MKSEKALRLIRILKDEKEYKLFLKFLRSPYFGKREGLLPYISELRKVSSDNESIDREELWTKLRGDTPLNDAYLRFRLSNLTSSAVDFFTQVQFNESSKERLLFKAKALYARGLNKEYEAVIGQIEKGLGDSEYTAPVDHLIRFEATILDEGENAKMVENDLDTFYLVRKLWRLFYNYGRLLRQGEHIFEVDKTLLNALKTIAQNNPHPLVKIYLLFLDFQQAIPSDDAIVELCREIIVYSGGLDQTLPREAIDAHLIIMNECTHKINQRDLRFMDFIVELYQSLIENGVKVDGRIFINMVNLHRIVSGANKTKRFIEENVSLVRDPSLDFVGYYARALVCFDERQWEKSSAWSSRSYRQINRERDFWLEIEARSLHLRSIFMQIYNAPKSIGFNEFEQIFNSNISFAKRAKNLPTMVTSRHISLWRVLSQVLSILGMPPSNRREAMAKLTQKAKNGGVAAQVWLVGLLSKIN